MRTLCALLVFGAAALLLSGQVTGEPSWQEAVQKANDAQSKGRSAEAEMLIQNAWTNVRRAGAADEYFPAGVQAVANFYVAAGFGLKTDGVLHAAEAAVGVLPAQHINRLSILALKAQTYNGQGRAIEAQAVFEQLLPLQVKNFGENSFEVRNTLQTLASSYDGSGELEKAEALFERLDSLIAKPAPPGTMISVMAIGMAQFVTTRNSRWFSVSGPGPIGLPSLADFYDRHGRFADAEKVYQSTIARAERADPQAHGLDLALRQYQSYLRNHRRYGEAVEVQLRLTQLHANSAEPANPGQEQADKVILAEIYMDAGKFDQANKTLERARADLLTKIGADSNEYHDLSQNYASVLIRQGRLQDAESVASELAELAPNDTNSYARINALNLLAQIHDQSGDPRGAEAYRAQAMAIQKSGSNNWDQDRAGEDIQSAQALLNGGEVERAWQLIESALSAAESAEPYRAVGYLNQIASMAYAFPDKNREQADQLIERVAAIQNRTLGPASPLYNPNIFANYYQSHDRPHEAQHTWDAYILALEDANGADHPRLADPLLQLANLFNQQNRLQNALAVARRTLAINEKTSGPNSNAALQTLGFLGQLYFNLPDEARAMESFERQIRISNMVSGRTQNHAQILSSVAMNYAQHQHFERAIELATEALNIVSEPEYDPQPAEYFRSVLNSIKEQKAAASQSGRAANGNPPSSRWLDTKSFANTNVR